MNKKLLKLIAAGAAILLTVIIIRHSLLNSSTTPLPTHTLYAASFPDANGTAQAISQWQGKITVINFWASWCPPCREEMPELSRLQDQYRDRGVIVLGISTDDIDKMREFAKTTKVSYPLLAGDMEAMAIGASLGNDKGVLPYTVIIQADGGIANTYFGRINQSLLEKTLLPLIKTSAEIHATK
ncbi:MAG: TlpA disulfide reductase family protein [Methylophilaceae bacterium]